MTVAMVSDVFIGAVLLGVIVALMMLLVRYVKRRGER